MSRFEGSVWFFWRSELLKNFWRGGIFCDLAGPRSLQNRYILSDIPWHFWISELAKTRAALGEILSILKNCLLLGAVCKNWAVPTWEISGVWTEATFLVKIAWIWGKGRPIAARLRDCFAKRVRTEDFRHPSRGAAELWGGPAPALGLRVGIQSCSCCNSLSLAPRSLKAARPVCLRLRPLLVLLAEETLPDAEQRPPGSLAVPRQAVPGAEGKPGDLRRGLESAEAEKIRLVCLGSHSPGRKEGAGRKDGGALRRPCGHRFHL